MSAPEFGTREWFKQFESWMYDGGEVRIARDAAAAALEWAYQASSAERVGRNSGGLRALQDTIRAKAAEIRGGGDAD